ncbi:MAG: alpha/beta hydrolase-fold protein [Bryobacteraceae bacterium]
MLPRTLTVFAVSLLSLPAEKLPVPTLIQQSKSGAKSAAFRQALADTLGQEAIAKGAAFAGHGPDFIWAVESEKTPVLYVDGQATGKMTRLANSNVWFQTGKLKTGTSHNFHYAIDGSRFGGNPNIPAYLPDSYEKQGVPQGKLSEKLVHTSRIYPGMKSDYWIWVPAQYNPSTPAALMVWQDGHGLVAREGSTRAQIVWENLIQQKKIPVMVHVLISPGLAEGERRMRSIQYDTVSDRYARFLRDEILAEVQAKYNVRKDGYSRGIAGNSSGGICAFNVAWQQPDQFSRVLSHIGSFTALQWRYNQPDPKDNLEGGNIYPFLVRREPKRNIRVWLQDGAEDLENRAGSWPLQNIQLANSLKQKEYDFHLSWGNGTHSAAHGNAELADSLTWLWRDYDPSKTEQTYEMEPAEREKPLFRITISNR